MDQDKVEVTFGVDSHPQLKGRLTLKDVDHTITPESGRGARGNPGKTGTLEGYLKDSLAR
jgi:hypothetical protein